VLKLPIGQREQLPAPGALKVPGGQVKQNVLALWLEKKPATQGCKAKHKTGDKAGETQTELKPSDLALRGACGSSELAENALLARRLASALVEPASRARQAPS
jgi:hypothetical protein